MQTHNVGNTAESHLAEIGGELLDGSGFENELPDSNFNAELITAGGPNPRED